MKTIDHEGVIVGLDLSVEAAHLKPGDLVEALEIATETQSSYGDIDLTV